MNEEAILRCNCGCGILEINKWDFGEDNEDYSLIYWVPAFYGKQQDNLLQTIKERVIRIWQIARGKEFYLYEVVATKEELQTFVSELSKML